MPDDRLELIKAIGGANGELDFGSLAQVKVAQAKLTDYAIAAAVGEDPAVEALPPEELGPVASLAARRRWGLAFTSLVEALAKAERAFLRGAKQAMA